MSDLLGHLDVSVTGDAQFDDRWHAVHGLGIKVMKGKRASFRLKNEGHGLLVLHLANTLPGMPLTKRRATVAVNGCQVGEIVIDQPGRVRHLFRFEPQPGDQLEVELGVDRLIAGGVGGEGVAGVGYGLALFEASVHDDERPVLCMEPWVTAFITWDGKVRPCCFSQSDLGDLDEKSLTDIWRDDPFVSLREACVAHDVPEDCRLCVENRRQKFELFSVAERLETDVTACKREDYPG